MFIIVYKRAIQIEKFGSNYTKHPTERKYVKLSENCQENHLTRLYSNSILARLKKKRGSDFLIDKN